MQQTASLAKISRPRLSKVVLRRRLFRLLDQGRDKSVLWISGPAGSGKTTLVASWLDSRKLPCLWYRLDPGDADLSTFFYYLGTAGKKAAPRVKQPLPLLTPEYLMDVPTFSRRYFEDLCGRVKPPFFLIFDNFQDVSSESAFPAVLASGVASVPEGVQMVFLSRTEPPPAFSGLLAGGGMEAVGWDDLQLTPAESGAIVSLHSPDRQDRKTIEWMHDRTRGWAAGVVLLARAAKARIIESGKVDALPPEKVFDYFASELFARADERMREFLIKTSVLPGMTPDMAEQLTGNSDAGSILDGLNRRNYFIYKSRQPGIAYQYHPLFRDFLLSRVKEQFGEAGAARLRKQAAGLLEASGQIEDSAILYMELKDWEGLARLALTQAPQLVSTGRHGLLDAWLSGLPAEMPETEPWLLYWNGVCRSFVNPIESQAIFEKVFGLFTARRDVAGIFLSWSGVVESITFANENVKPLDHWMELLPELVSSHGGFPSPDIERRVASSMFTAIVMRQPAHPDMEKWLEMALLASDSYSRARTLFHLAILLFIHGDEARWRAALDSFRRLVKTQGHFPLGAIQLKLCEAIYLRITGLPDLSMKVVDEGLKHAEQSGIRLLYSLTVGHGAFAALSKGDLATAQRYLDVYESKPMLNMWERNFHDYLLALHAMVRGDLRAALHHSNQSVSSSEQAGVPWTEVGCKFLNAMLLHRLGEHAKSDDVMRRAYEKMCSFNSNTNQYEYALCRAQFAMDLGREQEAMEFLRSAASMGKQTGYHNPLYCLLTPQEKVRICAKGLAWGIEPDFFREWIRRDNLMPEDPPLHIENWPWPLRIFTLGRFRIELGGKPMLFSRKMQKKPLGLLKMLAAQDGREAGESGLIDILWPEAEGDAAYRAFLTAVQRLRRLLGSRDAVRVRDGRISLDPRICWVDAWAFNHLFAQAGEAWRRGEKKKAIPLLERAVSLYSGPFLGHEGEEYNIVALRESLREKFLRCVGMLGRFHEEAGAWDKAAGYYHKGLEVDSIAEAFYRSLMVCYMNMDQPAKALDVYGRCRRVLKAALDVVPDAETEKLCRSIAGGKARNPGQR